MVAKPRRKLFPKNREIGMGPAHIAPGTRSFPAGLCRLSGMWIMIAGPYKAGAATPAAQAANLKTLNEAAVALHRAGHVPIIGVNMALPMIDAAGGTSAAYDKLMAPVSLALVDVPAS